MSTEIQMANPLEPCPTAVDSAHSALATAKLNRRRGAEDVRARNSFAYNSQLSFNGKREHHAFI